jgi:hypothetical protein
MSPWLFNFAFECANESVTANKEVLKLKGTHEHLVNAGDVNVAWRHTYYNWKQKSFIIH